MKRREEYESEYKREAISYQNEERIRSNIYSQYLTGTVFHGTYLYIAYAWSYNGLINATRHTDAAVSVWHHWVFFRKK
jgi:hypothetical protein